MSARTDALILEALWAGTHRRTAAATLLALAAFAGWLLWPRGGRSS